MKLYDREEHTVITICFNDYGASSVVRHSNENIFKVFMHIHNGDVMAGKWRALINVSTAILVSGGVNGIEPHQWKSTSGRHEII